MLRLVTALLLAMPLAAIDPVWLATFDQVWQLVHDKHWDPAELERSGWTRLKPEYRAKVAEAKSATEARGYIREMIQRLKLSHFHISGGEAVEEAAAAHFAALRLHTLREVIDGRTFHQLASQCATEEQDGVAQRLGFERLARRAPEQGVGDIGGGFALAAIGLGT